MYWESRHGWHFCVSCEAVCFWWPGGQLKSSYLPASSPDVERTHAPGIGLRSDVQFRSGVRSAQMPLTGHTAPDGQVAHETTDPFVPALAR